MPRSFFENIRNSETLQAFLVLSILVFLAFFDIIIGASTLKWDIIDANFPFQAFQSYCEQQGSISLWDPYTYLGSAMHSKMAMYYPLRFISAQISEYTLLKLNIEFVLHILVAGFGMYVFSKQKGFKHLTALFVSVGYMLSGFFVGNAQHMSWVISGALLPWVLWSYFLLVTSNRFIRIPLFALIFFSFISGRYPAFSIVACYGIGIEIIWKTILYSKSKQYSQLKKFFTSQIFALIPLLLLGGVIIVSHSDMVQLVARGNGVSLTQALFGSLRPWHAITTVFPFMITYIKSNFWEIDIAFVNMYIGISGILYTLFSIRLISQKNILKLWIFSLFFIALSLGNDIPLRAFFYEYVPLYNIFRFPALFRLFFMWSFLLLAAYSFEYIETRITKKQIITILCVIIAAYTSLAIYTLFVHTRNAFPEYVNWHAFVFTLDKTHAISIQSVTIAFIYICGLIYVLKRKALFTSHTFAKLMVFLMCTDMLTATLLQKAITVTNQQDAFTAQEKIDSLPKSIHTWDIHEQALNQYHPSLQIAKPLWRNNQIFYTKRTFDGYTSFIYKHTEILYRSPYFDTIARYPLFYVPQHIITETDTTYMCSSEKIAIIPDSMSFLKYTTGQAQLTFIEGSNNFFTIHAETSDSVLLVCMQNRYPGWTAYINSQETEILPVNHACMGIIIPNGTSEITFAYKPPAVILFHYIYQYSLYALCIILIASALLYALRNNNCYDIIIKSRTHKEN